MSAQSIVMKFGGTSVQDAAAMLRVKDIVRDRREERPVVVVSAMARVTRELVSLAEAAGAKDAARAEAILTGLRERHQEVAEDLLSGDVEAFIPAVERLDALFDELADQVDEILEEGLTPRSEAAVLAFGELLSSTLLATAFRLWGLEARWEDARQWILTDPAWLSAEPDLVAIQAGIARLQPAEVIVTQGFIASTKEGETTVLGFEGSDFSAALFGMALGAEAVEIWTDVDGIRSADPRIVPQTRRIDALSYDEAAAMAGLGARVLHPKTVGPARSRLLPIRVRDTRRPDGSGSVICGTAVPDGPKSIALMTGQDLAEVGLTLPGLKDPAALRIHPGQSLVSVVGQGVPSAQKVREALADFAPIVAEGPLSLSILVPAEDARDVVCALHGRLFG